MQPASQSPPRERWGEDECGEGRGEERRERRGNDMGLHQTGSQRTNLPTLAPQKM